MQLNARLIGLLSVLGAVVVSAAVIIIHDVRKANAVSVSHSTKPLELLPPRPASAFHLIRHGTLLELAHTSAIVSMAGSSDGKRFATGADQTVKIWDLERGKVDLVLAGHEAQVRGIAFTHDDKRLITGGGKSIRIWDSKSGAQLATIPLPDVTSLRISPDDKSLIAAAADGNIRVYDLNTQAR